MLLTPLLLLSCAALPGPAGPASPQQWEPERAPIPHLPPDRGDAPLPLGDRTAGEPAAWTWTETFFPEADMDPAVRAPEAWLRQPLAVAWRATTKCSRPSPSGPRRAIAWS